MTKESHETPGICTVVARSSHRSLCRRSALRCGMLRRAKHTRTTPFACGKTKVYFNAGAQERLETLRTNYFERKVLVIQAWGRKEIAMGKLDRIRWSIGML
jgi:myosin heavy subunit